MLWIAGGRKLLMDREGLLLAAVCGVTAGGVAILCNLEIVNLTRLTNVFAGAAVLLILFIYTRIRRRSFVDRSVLVEKDMESERSLSLTRASTPWILLVILSLATTLIEPIRQLLAVDLDLVASIHSHAHRNSGINAFFQK
jgi:hypothetical protein